MAKVLIIGAGGAALSAAISAKEQGAEVIVVTKEYPTRSQTCMAQGGINAAISKEDSIDSHIADTLKSAKGLADEKAVELMCSKAPEAISWLDSIGVPFSRTQDAKIAQRRLGGATHPRACYAQDYTGLKILHTLYDYANKLEITFLNERFLLELLVEDNRAYGALFLNIRSGEVEAITADSVIIATGGYSKLYNTHSTNSKAATGDGIAAAARVGAKLSNMEFVQFHPTALKSSAILISESARGAGGKLLNSKGERFVDELKPRDEVSLAIYKEMQKGEDILLDITHLGEAFIEEELPQERKLAILYEGIDPVKAPLPIKPAAHYTMGGIAVDLAMQSSIEALYAVGECSESKVHGANRLGGNSLLEIVVFGKIAGENAAKQKATQQKEPLEPIKKAKEKLQKLLQKEPKANFYQTRVTLGDLFYTKCGIKRNAKELEELVEFIEQTKASLTDFGISDTNKSYNTNLTDYLEFENILQVAEFVAKGALDNQESIGAHRRSDI
ncbi:Succinate dehydrogenase flavoprotein subunit [hydrothermal vent metagenome]|uniref:Succinate dehydrogenase flavoprotein subunit n=1 Tax=hydrothermal vent metagenome TaxID=652676 RepID=A0A1W1C1L2_9ZZZZ